MKLHFTSDWLRRHIETDPDLDCEAGFPLRDATPLKRFVEEEKVPVQPMREVAPEQKTAVLHVLVYQVRRRDKLSIEQFADRIRVDAAELRSIEEDPGYSPRPRTLHKLAEYLKVPATAVQSLTADAIIRNDNIEDAALRFAASSDDLTALSRNERQELNAFVKFLSTLDKGK
ncbi:helix-turn-helix transcriptional regulator [uncultured Roseibium sp.]|uniref:helix-turn-helix domain-containing protein n=1 Tax=uncultured Roseibium sp. TaxID=1936171 RepID=UPI0026088697|nr:helix-turn-helix transcriptional regulator [uncultured Roseibium sp.]